MPVEYFILGVCNIHDITAPLHFVLFLHYTTLSLI